MHIVKLQFLPPAEEKKKLQHLIETDCKSGLEFKVVTGKCA
jgi:hypothetical protein